jgi:hypothetical protein
MKEPNAPLHPVLDRVGRDIHQYMLTRSSALDAFWSEHRGNVASIRAARSLLKRCLASQVVGECMNEVSHTTPLHKRHDLREAAYQWASLAADRATDEKVFSYLHWCFGERVAAVHIQREMARQNMHPRLSEFQLQGQQRAQAALAHAVANSMYAEFEPLPDDYYAVRVKEEAAERFRIALQTLDSPAESASAGFRS